jgi:hypothetical protein
MPISRSLVQDGLAFCRDHLAHFKAPRTALEGGGYDRRVLNISV